MTAPGPSAARRDVALFDRLARLYEFAMPAADTEVLAAGLAYAERDLDRVLDVGGGTGRAARAVGTTTQRSDAGRGDGSRSLVLDAARGMLREARAAGLEGIQADAGTLPVRDESVDAVLVVDALHHVPSAGRAIAEAARVLRPGGVLVIREFDPTTIRGRALTVLERAVGFDSTFYPAGDLADLVEDAGLASSLPDRGFGYTVVGVKRGA